MRVLYIHQHFCTPQGCGGTRSYEFAIRLIQAGHQVTMVSGSAQLANTGLTGEFLKGIRRGNVHGIDVIEINIPYSNHDGNLKRIFKFIKFGLITIKVALKEKYDLIYATSTPLTVAIPALFAHWIRRKKMIFEVRDLWPELPRAMGAIKNPFILYGMDVLETLAYKNAACVVGLSPGICKGVLAKTKYEKKVVMIPNGCDIEFFSQGKRDKSLLLKFGISPNDFVFIFSGAHGLANGLQAVLDAALLVQEAGAFNIKFLFVGDGKLKPALIEFTKQNQLDNCIFVDPIPKEELRDILKSVDVGMMVLKNIPAFYYGTSPNKFFDYLACGLPIITNYPGWVADLIEEYQCGKAVAPDNAQLFARAIIELSKENSDHFGKNSLKLAKKEFDRNLLSKNFQSFCEGIAK